AIVNLLLNACEACQAGEHVEVAARADAESVAFVVTDDGAGIASEHAARATKPFFTTKAEAGGAGLGLAIATEIAKSHRGDLTIGPHAGRGTRACIEIPIAGHRGHEAMHRLRTERFDALVTDLRMPEVDGLALMRASLELDPSRPVIMMTAHV